MALVSQHTVLLKNTSSNYLITSTQVTNFKVMKFLLIVAVAATACAFLEARQLPRRTRGHDTLEWSSVHVLPPADDEDLPGKNVAECLKDAIEGLKKCFGEASSASGEPNEKKIDPKCIIGVLVQFGLCVSGETNFPGDSSAIEGSMESPEIQPVAPIVQKTSVGPKKPIVPGYNRETERDLFKPWLV